MRRTQSRQKSYADRRRRPLEFEVGDQLFMKTSLVKSLGKYKSRGKLSPRYIGPYEILERIGKVAYRITLPPEMANFYDVFHVSMLRNCRPDSEKIFAAKQEELTEDMSVNLVLVQDLQHEERRLRNKTVPK